MTTDRRAKRLRRWFVERALLLSISVLAVIIAGVTMAFSVLEQGRQVALVDQFIRSEADARATLFMQMIKRMLDRGVLQANVSDVSHSLHGEFDALQFARFGSPSWDAFGLFSEPRECGADASGWWVAHYLSSNALDTQTTNEFGRSLYLTIALPICEATPYRRLRASRQTLDSVSHFVVSAVVGGSSTQWHGVIEEGPQGLQPELWLVRPGIEPAQWPSWRSLARRQGAAGTPVSLLASPKESSTAQSNGLLLRVELPLSLLMANAARTSVDALLSSGVNLEVNVSFAEGILGRQARALPARPLGAMQRAAFANRVKSYAESALNRPDKVWVTAGASCEELDHLDDLQLDYRSLLSGQTRQEALASTLHGRRRCEVLKRHGVVLLVRPALGGTATLPSSNALWFGTVVLAAVGAFYAAVYGLVIRRLRRITVLLSDKGQRIVDHYRGDRRPRDEIDLLARAAADGIRARKREIEDAHSQIDAARKEARETQARIAERVTVALGLKHVIGNDLAQLGRYFERSKEGQADDVVQGIMRWVESFCEAETAYDFVGRGARGLSINEIGHLLNSLKVPDAIRRECLVPPSTLVVTESFLLGAAIGQLIENAMRETRGVAEQIVLRAQWAPDGRVDVVVQNQGWLRLDPEMVFDLSVSDSDRSKLGRRGLGLYLVRLIMSRMEGTAHAQQVGDKVEFTLRLHTETTGAEVLARDDARRLVRGGAQSG